jgi:hypothetical protein
MLNFFWNYSDTLFPFLVLLMLIIIRPKLKGGVWLWGYVIITVLLMEFSNYLADRGIHNMYLYHIDSLVEVGLLLPYISVVSFHSLKLPRYVFLGFLVCWLMNIFILEPFTQFNSNTASLAALLVAGFSFRYYFALSNRDEILHFQRLPSFWIVSGLLFYSVVTVLILGSYKYKQWFSDINTHVLWKIQQVANIIKFIFVSIGIICSYRQTSRDGLS